MLLNQSADMHRIIFIRDIQQFSIAWLELNAAILKHLPFNGWHDDVLCLANPPLPDSWNTSSNWIWIENAQAGVCLFQTIRLNGKAVCFDRENGDPISDQLAKMPLALRDCGVVSTVP